jgi:hypothetical protein
MRKNLWLAVLMAVVFPMAAAAGTPVSGSVALQPSFEVSAPAPAGGPTLAPTTLAVAAPFVGGVTYRPRQYRSHAQVMPVTTQLHVGYFDPNEDFDGGFDCGFRIGPQVDPHVQVGVAMDWWHRTENQEVDLGMVEAPGGSVEERLVLSESTADLIPMLGFVQVSGDENMSVIPYAGFGLGYEWLFLNSDDYVAQESFDQTFGGFGWQVWGGLGVPLSGQARLNGEVFYNGCEAGSDVDVYLEDYGLVTVRDIVKMNGVGARVGIAWGF